ncbi:DUF2569 family protein [Alkalibacter mobilis]|uniref:DUF2569 family protein n=1 Tax=Alkalibacter mobilis TaxID=2787712 RepID=UPI0018A0671B|nr:DUF2569 family protein [Alkalibacter mobilis]MBF7097434.1 DUF2569 family protein [Alkalibacter mobilis]
MVSQYLDDTDVLKGIGGWLIVMILGFLCGVAAVAHMVLGWSELGSQSIYLTVSVYLALVLGAIFSILFVAALGGKSRLTQSFAIAVGNYFICFAIIDLLFFEGLTLLGIGRFLGIGLFSVIWMLYFSLSERVSNTFIKTYSRSMRSFLTNIALWIFGMLAVIHIALVIMVKGVWQTILTLILPVVSEIYWFVKMWMDDGFLNPFTGILIVYVFAVALPFFMTILYAPERD